MVPQPLADPAVTVSPCLDPGYTLDIAAQEIVFVVGPLITLAAVALGGPAAGTSRRGGAEDRARGGWSEPGRGVVPAP